MFRISIIGLGLMGGSFARALSGFRDCEITAYDVNQSVLDEALKQGCIHKKGGSLAESVENADVVMFCTAPKQVLENTKICMPHFKSGAVITEICGVKERIVAYMEQHLPSRLRYIGIHPMAGKEVGGFENSEKALFNNAGFIIVRPNNHNKDAEALMVELSLYVGAGRVCVNSAKEHDDIIAYTSDLPHVTATALCVTHPKGVTPAHCAGAFRDCTRVANIDADLWTELFMENAPSLKPHLENYINELQSFKDALDRNDIDYVHRFLSKAHMNKNSSLKLK